MDAVPLPDGEPVDPEPMAEGEVARYVVAAAVWAPSVHNTQPWRFTARERQISLYADTQRQLRVADPDGREMMISCGAALLTTPQDRPADWIKAGQALQRILLTASACGIAAALHTQPLELGWLRDTIQTRLSDGAYPQMVLRLGAVIQAATSVRRPPEDVLSESGSEGTNASDE